MNFVYKCGSQYPIFSIFLAAMIYKLTETPLCLTKKFIFDEKEQNQLECDKADQLAEVDGVYVRMKVSSDPRVVFGRVFSHHLRNCGILDGFNSTIFVNCNFVPKFQCKVTLNVSDGCGDYKIQLELSYTHRLNERAIEHFGIDKDKISVWLFDCLVQKDESRALFNMQMKYALKLIKVRCFIDDLEIEI